MAQSVDVLWDMLDSCVDMYTSGNRAAKDDRRNYDCVYCKKDGMMIVVDGVNVCQDCNAVVGRCIDGKAEWRFYGSEDNKRSDPTRCGMPMNELLPKSSLGSNVNIRMGASCNPDMRIIQKFHNWGCMDHKERVMYNIFETIERQASENGITQSIIQEAKQMYKMIADKQTVRMKNKRGLMASSIYMSCKLNGATRSPLEISEMFNEDQRVISKGCKLFNDCIKIKAISKSADFIMRFCSKLGMDNAFKELCKRIAVTVDGMAIATNHTPLAVAASCICLSAEVEGRPLDFDELVDVCGLSHVTLNKCMRDLNQYREMVFINKNGKRL
jgi:transcription initiation factor TFIIB